MQKKIIKVNGSPRTVIVDPETSLADVLRRQLGMTGTKIGCGMAQCGSCSVIMDGKVIRSCVTKMKKVEDGADIITIEGVGTPENLHPIQLAWMVHGGAHEGLRPLGIKPEQIKLVMNDTAITPNSGPAGGSRSQVVTGQAIRAGCEVETNLFSAGNCLFCRDGVYPPR